MKHHKIKVSSNFASDHLIFKKLRCGVGYKSPLVMSDICERVHIMSTLFKRKLLRNKENFVYKLKASIETQSV